MTISTAAPGRREANRERTRQAIEDAAYALIEEHGLDGLTAEQVADRAGISRRTFFNYFSSVDAVLADNAATMVENLSDLVAQRPLDEPLFDSIDAVVGDAFPIEHLRQVATSWRAAAESEGTARQLAHLERQISERIAIVLHGRLAERHCQADALAIRTLACCLVAASAAARDQWLHDTGGRVTPTTHRRLRALLREAIAHLGAGFATLDPGRTPRP